MTILKFILNSEDYLKNNDSIGLAKWFKELSKNEKERIKKFK